MPETLICGEAIPAPPAARSLQAFVNLSEIAAAKPHACDRAWNDPIFIDAFEAAKRSFLYEEDKAGDVWTKSYRYIRLLFGGFRRVRVGDCEESADHFKDVLAARGIPYGSMSFAAFETGPDEGHMVLAVWTAEDGTLIFDIWAGSPIRYSFAAAKWLVAFAPGDFLWREIVEGT